MNIFNGMYNWNAIYIVLLRLRIIRLSQKILYFNYISKLFLQQLGDISLSNFRHFTSSLTTIILSHLNQYNFWDNLTRSRYEDL